ncbi:intracellular protease, PfpI family [Methanocella conradii HZ254]|uniref:Intracellular protease, PfpI family n=1 Tax=Methanocella conradii (strain DSM 24694 / JCM 17849 / CGMCC 1.5162 / HZ254) TaxID=1041930 RepID=H8IA70_METCZ|nr:type 1 glutamine amidotransferase domain-containing protein [Methanocella conradii]AFC99136.1 intracellular protease, PfpI family [Methanocella conradii HZ254]MDI6896618.1 type 1 glutamine amidotransferase domain-containing protein [Methanocella conradii]
MEELKGKRIVMLAGDGFEDMELMYPLVRLRDEACADVTIAGLKELEALRGKNGLQVTTELSFKDLRADSFDALVIPGGQSPDHIRIYPDVIRFVQDFDRTGKPIASICHGIQILITARLLKGKTATGWKSLAVEIENAGASYVDSPLVTSGQYIFSRQPSDLGFFCDAIIRSLRGESLQPLVEAARAI